MTSPSPLRDLVDALERNREKPRLKLDPELGDGQHWTICDQHDPALLEIIQLWMSDAETGDKFTVELVLMTDAEVEALPDI